MYGTDRKESPKNCPELYRQATMIDVIDNKVDGFYEPNGSYWRKNGQPKSYRANPQSACVPVKYGMYSFDYVDIANVHKVFIRKDEDTKQHHAIITWDTGDNEVSVYRYPHEDFSNMKVLVQRKDDGREDWPIKYPSKGIAYDYPELWDDKTKKAVIKAFDWVGKL
jgi:hypothetical protein